MQPTVRQPVEDSLEVCPECGYDGGFHVLLERCSAVAGSNLRLYLKCPNCRTAYDVEWISRLAE